MTGGTWAVLSDTNTDLVCVPVVTLTWKVLDFREEEEFEQFEIEEDLHLEFVTDGMLTDINLAASTPDEELGPVRAKGIALFWSFFLVDWWEWLGRASGRFILTFSQTLVAFFSHLGLERTRKGNGFHLLVHSCCVFIAKVCASMLESMNATGSSSKQQRRNGVWGNCGLSSPDASFNNAKETLKLQRDKNT